LLPPVAGSENGWPFPPQTWRAGPSGSKTPTAKLCDSNQNRIVVRQNTDDELAALLDPSG
jgi:hypothetical protein